MQSVISSPAPAAGEARTAAQQDRRRILLVQWVTGRASVSDVEQSLEVAVRLLLRPLADR